jgi:hypothetical protein
VLLVVSGLILGGAGVGRATAPNVIWGAKDGPVGVHGGTLATVAALPLPAGDWWITATGVLEASGGTFSEHRGVTCRLEAGVHADAIGAAPNATGGEGSRVPFLLTTAHHFGAPGKAKLRCVGEGATGSVKVKDIRITATRAGRLTVQDVSGGTTTTTGSGTPRIIAQQSSAILNGVGGGAYHLIAQLAVPAGRWWIVAKTTLGGVGVSGYECRLRAGGDFDLKQFGVSSPGLTGDAVPVALQVVHRFASAGVVELECRGPWHWTATWVALAAVRAGTLTNRALDNGSQVTGGSGTPRVISGYSDGPKTIARSDSWQTIRALSLPAGRWSVIGTLAVQDSVPYEIPARQVACRLVFGVDSAETRLRQNANVTDRGVMVTTLTHSSGSAGSVKLQCRRTGGAGSVVATFIKITAIQASLLSQRAL